VSGARDKTIKLWNTLGECKYTIGEPDGHTEWVSCVRFSPVVNNPLIVSAGWDRQVKARARARRACDCQARARGNFHAPAPARGWVSPRAPRGRPARALWALLCSTAMCIVLATGCGAGLRVCAAAPPGRPAPRR
jgi:hypothetical protein